MSAVASPSLFSPPTELGEYRLVRPLGQGAMGQVYLYLDSRLSRHVAVKFLRSESAHLRERFQIEAKAIARLNHPNVVGVYRFGDLADSFYLVSEFVEGDPLDRLEMPVPFARLLGLARGLARGLAHAHQEGVLHRDIKPANAILARSGEVKLLDFGLAKLDAASAPSWDAIPPIQLSELPEGAALAVTTSFSGPVPQAPPEPATPSDAGLTAAGAILGTPLYIAPELWRGEPATQRSDVYSLGVLLYELASGRVPHQGANITALGAAVLTQEAPPLRTHAPQLDPRLCAIVDRCLRPEPAARFPSGQAVSEALEDLLTQLPTRSVGRRRALRWTLGVGPPILAIVAGAPYLAGKLRVRPQRILVPGGTFRMGSSEPEMQSAYLWCNSQYPVIAGGDGTTKPAPRCPLATFEREQPLRTVSVSSFYLDTTEVTNQAYADWLNRRPGLRVELYPDKKEIWVLDGAVRLLNLYPIYEPPFGLEHQGERFVALPGLERQPARQVTWHGALRYCQDKGMRLPTEAEWEFAARGKEERRFPWGAVDPRCDGVVFGRRANLQCSGQDQIIRLQDVGTSWQDRTPLGIYDLGGGVAEWVMDRFIDRYQGCPAPCLDPVVKDVDAGAAGTGSVTRVFRGGAYDQQASLLRAAGRSRWREDEALQNLGFRCAGEAR